MTSIFLAGNYELAKNIQVAATVEAEYGRNVVYGTNQTLAHHVEAFRKQPAPCNAVVKVLKEEDDILISHLDLDTLGGIMALMGEKPEDEDFWVCAEFIDLNGPHHLHRFPKQQDKMNAYFCFSENNRLGRFEEVRDVTDDVRKHIEAVKRILGEDQELLLEGKRWEEEKEKEIEQSLVCETTKMRVFKGEVFTAASYYSKKLDTVTSVTVNYNTKYQTITVATSDNSIDCCELMQTLFGNEAGGHRGIAGSPRGEKMTEETFEKVIETVKEKIS